MHILTARLDSREEQDIRFAKKRTQRCKGADIHRVKYSIALPTTDFRLTIPHQPTSGTQRINRVAKFYTELFNPPEL